MDGAVAKKKTDLMIAKAKEQPGEPGIRYLISESFEAQAIIEALDISEEEYNTVKSKVDAELAEIARVKELLASVEDKSEEDKIKHLIDNGDYIAESGVNGTTGVLAEKYYPATSIGEFKHSTVKHGGSLGELAIYAGHTINRITTNRIIFT